MLARKALLRGSDPPLFHPQPAALRLGSSGDRCTFLAVTEAPASCASRSLRSARRGIRCSPGLESVMKPLSSEALHCKMQLPESSFHSSPQEFTLPSMSICQGVGLHAKDSRCSSAAPPYSNVSPPVRGPARHGTAHPVEPGIEAIGPGLA